MGPDALAQVLQPLAQVFHPDLLVGLQTSDDAAVYRLRGDLAIIQTVDFFTPIVDDPYSYGAIAAANSLSDVYAMGGTPLLALNIAAIPEDLPASIVAEIFRGGAEKAAEAGAIIAGGHTVTDNEPKYGLAVTGTIHPDRILRKGGARPGDRLFLTKRLGTGVISTALKNEAASFADLAHSVASMSTLNAAASRLIVDAGTTSCTDVTGFGLAGHAQEMAIRSGVQLTIAASTVPILSGALDYARAGHLAGGLMRNRDYYQAQGVRLASAIDPAQAALLFDPQTSGGLLFTVPIERGEECLRAFAAAGLDLWEIGAVADGFGVGFSE